MKFNKMYPAVEPQNPKLRIKKQVEEQLKKIDQLSNGSDKVKSLVDKEICTGVDDVGFGSKRTCRTINKNSIHKGYIDAKGNFYSPRRDLNYVFLERNEYEILKDDNMPDDYEPPETLYGNFTNRNIKLFLGALIIGFLIYKYNKK